VSPAQKARRPEMLAAVLGPALGLEALPVAVQGPAPGPEVPSSAAGELVPDGVDDCSG
jgi:hypothetical protein